MKPEFYVKPTMDHFGTNYRQMPSQEANCDGYYYKTPVTERDVANLNLLRLAQQLAYSQDPTNLDSYISLQREKRTSGFRYRAVEHGPLSVFEARQCLGDLVNRIYQALSALHDLGFSHLNVHLENICFDSSYSVKFIDLDRAMLTDEVRSNKMQVIMMIGLDWVVYSNLHVWCALP